MVPEKNYKTPSDELALPRNNSPISALQKDLNQLNAAGQGLDENAKWKEYERIFKSYFAFANADKSVAYTPTDPTDLGVTDNLVLLFEDQAQDTADRFVTMIHDSLPKSLKNKGLLLLKFLAYSPDAQLGNFKFSSNGRLMRSGQEIFGSNIIDLVNHALRTRKPFNQPQGWYDFLEMLQRANVPTDLLARGHRRQLVKLGQKQPGKEVSNSSGPAGQNMNDENEHDDDDEDEIGALSANLRRMSVTTPQRTSEPIKNRLRAPAKPLKQAGGGVRKQRKKRNLWWTVWI